MSKNDTLQTLPSSLREKQRYIIFEILSDDTPDLGAFVNTAWDTMLDLLGERGVAQAQPWILKDLYDVDQQKGGIRVHKDHVEDVRAALTLITEIDRTPVTVHVLGVTGTMDSAEEKYLR